MKHLLATSPIPSFEDYSSSHLRAGKAYQRRLMRNPGRALMWDLEKSFLQRVLASQAPREILDFACGTGRIALHMEACSPAARLYGIDISESMLEIARASPTNVQFLKLDSRAAISTIGEGHFDLITAFRFFANADRTLSLGVSADLSRLLTEDGMLVVNNHRNFWSLPYLARRALGEEPFGALNGRIEKLFTDHGFRVKEKVSLGVWPQGEMRAMLLPWSMVARLERANQALTAAYHSLGYNTIWVLSRA